MTAPNDDKMHPQCVFYGGTLAGQKHRRLMFGFVTETILEPVFSRDRHGNASRKDTTHRQVYKRSPRDDKDGALGYILYAVEEVAKP